MRDEIIEKLRLHLQTDINTEASCVYLLAQIRKFLEQQQIQRFWNLRMCANWTLHSTLDNGQNRTVRLLLEEANEFLAASERDGAFVLDSQHPLSNKLLFATSLHDELFSFLSLIELDTSICENPERLNKLLTAFGGVINDTPLICKPEHPLSHLHKITFTKTNRIEGSELPFSISWHFYRIDKPTLDITIEPDTYLPDSKGNPNALLKAQWLRCVERPE